MTDIFSGHHYVIDDRLAAEPRVRHGFFTRQARPDEMGGEALAIAKQRHTADVVVVEAAWPRDDAPVADAMVTYHRGLALGIVTADCAPVLFADTTAGVIGAAHAGWRGAFDGVIAATVTAMVALGASRTHIVAAVGPCIGPNSYEVGPEFVARFVDRDPGFAIYFAAPTPKSRFDLPRFVADRLRDAGVGFVSRAGHDTFADEARFFSFRRATLRGEVDAGRQVSAIALT